MMLAGTAWQGLDDPRWLHSHGWDLHGGGWDSLGDVWALSLFIVSHPLGPLSKYGLSLQQPSWTSLFENWSLREQKQKIPGLLRARPRTCTVLFPLHSIGESKSQGYPRFNRRGNTLHFLMGWVPYMHRVGEIVHGHLWRQFTPPFSHNKLQVFFPLER